MVVSTAPDPVLVRAHQCQNVAQRTSPLTVQTARKMGAVRTSGIAELLETYKNTQQSTINAQSTNKRAQRPDEPDSPEEPRRGALPRQRTLQQRMEDEAKDKDEERRVGVDRYRIRQHKCPNSECEDPSAPPEVDADGNSMCPSCGYVDENAAPELAGAGQQDISDVEGGNRRTFLQDGGADNRTGQEWQDDANRALYVIEGRDVPKANEEQRWWANNRMNQSMVWADFMEADRGMPGGFAITHDEVRRIKDVLRVACIAVAKHAPNNDAGNEGDDGGRFGSPLVWTTLLALEMIARRPEGFMVATEAMQRTATLRALHLYMRKFQGTQAKRYVEMLNAFRTSVKGDEAKLAQRSLDRVKTRAAAWHPLGSDPAIVQAKVATLDKILKMSGAFEPGVGLSAPVIAGVPPGLLAVRPGQIQDAASLARNKGSYNPSLVNRSKEQARGHSYFRPKDWDRADKSLRKGPPQPENSAQEHGQEQEQGQEGMPGGDDQEDSDDDDDDDDDEFGGLKLTKAERRVVRQVKQQQQQQQQQQPTQRPSGMSRFEDGPNAPSDPMNVDPAPAPAPAPDRRARLLEDDPDAQMAALGVRGTEPAPAPAPAPSGSAEGGGSSGGGGGGSSNSSANGRIDDFLNDLEEDTFAVVDDNTEGVDGDDGADGADGADDGANSSVTDSAGAITELEGAEDAEDDIPQRALDLSLDLSGEAFEEQQRVEFELLQAGFKEWEEELKLQAVEDAEARLAAQEAVEAPYRQEGKYDRSKDPRNDLELGKKTATPSYAELLKQGRRDRPEYKGIRAIRALTYDEVKGSANFHRHGFLFVREWQEEQRKWHAELRDRVERLENAEEIKAASRQQRNAKAAERKEKHDAKEARKEQGRRKAERNLFNKSDKKMDAQQRRGKGEFSINARDSSPLHPVIRKAEDSDLLIRVVVPGNGKRKSADGGEANGVESNQREESGEREYTYSCSNCGTKRRVKGKKPEAGWDCADGSYACKRRYSCKHCNRSILKEGDSSDEFECKDLGKECLSLPKRRK